MLIIRDSQRHLFREAARRRFEDQLFAHLRETFPERVRPIGEAATRRTIRRGLERMEPFGIRKGPNAAVWVTLMLYLGSDFDDDPMFPWAPPLLEAVRHDESRGMAVLRAAALEHRDRAGGENNENVERTLARLRSFELEELVPERVGNFDDWAIEQLRFLQPEKCSAAGQTALERLAAEGRRTAGGLGLGDDRAAGLFIGCMFMLGHRFHVDPQYPWAEALVADRDAKAPLKMYRLFRAALRHVDEQLPR
jgi:hypothetical protein